MYVIKVYEHKTGPSGEARVVLIQELYEQFKIFLFRSRAEINKMLNKSGESVKYFICPLERMSYDFQPSEQKFANFQPDFTCKFYLKDSDDRNS